MRCIKSRGASLQKPDKTQCVPVVASDDEECGKPGEEGLRAPLLAAAPDPTGLSTRRSVDIASAHAIAAAVLPAGSVPVLARAESMCNRQSFDSTHMWVLPEGVEAQGMCSTPAQGRGREPREARYVPPLVEDALP